MPKMPKPPYTPPTPPRRGGRLKPRPMPIGPKGDGSKARPMPMLPKSGGRAMPKDMPKRSPKYLLPKKSKRKP